MRILTVCRDLERGGTQRVAQTLALEYQAAGHESAVFATTAGGVRQQRLEQAGLPVFVGGEGEDFYDGVRAAVGYGFDVVHFHRPGAANPEESEVLRRLKTAGKPIVETSHFGRVDASPAGKLIDAHLQISRWCLWRWRRWAGRALASKPAAVVPNPVDCARFKPASPEAVAAFRQDELVLPADALLVGRIGQAAPGKWHPATLTAFERLLQQQPTARLLMIGLPEIAHQQLEELKPATRDRILLHPLVDSDERLALLYSSFDLFLHAAQIGETFGLVLAEAMLCGAPPVTLLTPHRDNSQGEVVGHNQAGIVALSAASLPEALCLAAGDAQLRARLSAACRQSIESRFESSVIAGLALRALTHTVEAEGAADLGRRFAEDESLITEVPDAFVAETLRDGVGRVAWKDRLLLNAVVNPTLYALYNAARRARGR